MLYGLDIGGSKIEIALFDEHLELQDRWRVDTPTDNYQLLVDTIVSLVIQADAKTGVEARVGIGMPGVLDENNHLLCANIPCVNGKNILQALEQRLNRPIIIENDNRCFVISEALHGAGEGFNNVFCAIIGTGAAGGLSIDGKLYKSRQGISGEYGHMQLSGLLQQKYHLPVRQCGCGLLNCYETFISGPGLEFLYQHFLKMPFDNADNKKATATSNNEPLDTLGDTQGDNNEVSAKQIVDLWQLNDPIAAKTIDCYFDLLGACFANLVIAYDPDIIVLGGGLSLIKQMGSKLNDAIDPYLFGNFNAPPIVGAKFGDASGVRGAALLAKQHAVNPNIHDNPLDNPLASTA